MPDALSEQVPQSLAEQPRQEPATADLVHAASHGDEQAWNAIVERFASLIWHVARGYRLSQADAADVSQTTWLRLAEHIGTLRDPDSLGSWLATTASRECLGLLRRSRVQHWVDDEEVRDLPDVSPGSQVDQALLAREELSNLWQEFVKLSERCQLLLRLLFADPAVPYEQISSLTSLPVGSIGPTRARCLAKLRALLPE